jgi:hypothetical protein
MYTLDDTITPQHALWTILTIDAFSNPFDLLTRKTRSRWFHQERRRRSVGSEYGIANNLSRYVSCMIDGWHGNPVDWWSLGDHRPRLGQNRLTPHSPEC